MPEQGKTPAAQETNTWPRVACNCRGQRG